MHHCKIVIADDHPLFRAALKQAVSKAARQVDIVEVSGFLWRRLADQVHGPLQVTKPMTTIRPRQPPRLPVPRRWQISVCWNSRLRAKLSAPTPDSSDSSPKAQKGSRLRVKSAPAMTGPAIRSWSASVRPRARRWLLFPRTG